LVDIGPSILVNYWYANAVGHAIEGLRYCLGYARANSLARVSILLNGAAPSELPSCCPFVDAAYLVPFTRFVGEEGDPRAALADVPRDWDWVVDNPRERDPGHDAIRGFRRFFDASHAHFLPRSGTGFAGGTPPAYEPHQRLRLELPAEARSAAATTLAGRRAISIVLAGHSEQRAHYPSTTSWELILGELGSRLPNTIFCLIGRTPHSATRRRIAPGVGTLWRGEASLNHEAQTASRIGRDEIRRIAAASRSVDCFDRPLLEQLAIVEASSLFVSPHTGFGFAALAVGTPWLTISGGSWHESFFNGVPFHSVLPDTRRYPCFMQGGPRPPMIGKDEDGEGARTPSMSAARIRDDLPEILDAAEALVEGRVAYEQALEAYFPRLLAAYGNDRSRVFSFDDLHRAYV
jgi:hypothetical protein